VSLGVLDLIYQASIIVQLVLLGLVGLSIVSWSVIAYKMRELRRAQQDSEAFLEVYHSGSPLGAE
jgi:biopolymer transport protein TolQ